jgi:hypothetical protein
MEQLGFVAADQLVMFARTALFLRQERSSQRYNDQYEQRWPLPVPIEAVREASGAEASVSQELYLLASGLWKAKKLGNHKGLTVRHRIAKTADIAQHRFGLKEGGAKAITVLLGGFKTLAERG